MADYARLRTMHRPIHEGDLFSRLHPKMPRHNRAKLFAPFDALTGFDQSMDAETVFTVHPAELSEEMKQELDRKLNDLFAQYKKLPKKRSGRRGLLQVSILYFEVSSEQTMLHNDGIRGNYRWLSGDLLDIDQVRRTIDLGSRRLDMNFIYAIE